MQQLGSVVPDLDHLNKYFVSIDQVLSSKLRITENNAKIITNEETMFMDPNDGFESS